MIRSLLASRTLQLPTLRSRLRIALFLAAAPFAGPSFAQLTVGPSGLVNTSITLSVPPGIAKSQPSIALNYTGQPVNSDIGHGWQLGGMSIISRCPAIRAIDGATTNPSGVTFGPIDKLCIDGLRMIRTDATGTNPTVGVPGANDAAGLSNLSMAEFRVENDAYSRIRAYGDFDPSNSAGGPLYFKVWTKDGHVLLYGNWPGSDGNTQAVVAGTPATGDGYKYAQAWLLARRVDVAGNFVDFKYSQADINWGSTVQGSSAGHSWHISEIQYSGNKIVFSYSQLQSSSPQEAYESYTYGSKNLALNSLDYITTYVNSANVGALGPGAGAIAVKTYHLGKAKSAVTNRQLLKYVQECAGGPSSTNCLPYATYQYGIADSASPVLPELTSLPNFVMKDLPLSGINRGFLTGKFTSSGRTDILSFSVDPTQQQLWVSSGNGMFNQVLSAADGGKFNITDPFMDEPAYIGCTSYIVGDFNNDGLDDIFYYVSQGSAYGYNWITCPKTQSSAIFFSNGDGSFTKKPVSGVVPYSQQAVFQQITYDHFQWSEGDQFFLLDIDGDGILDLVQTKLPSADWYTTSSSNNDPCASVECTQVFKGDGNGGFARLATNLAHTTIYSQSQAAGLLGTVDIDGDGHPDIFISNQSVASNLYGPLSYYAARSRGDGNFDILNGPKCPAPDAFGLCHNSFIDYDGSGKPGRFSPGTSAATNQLFAASSKSNMSTLVTNSNLSTDSSRVFQDDQGGTGWIISDFNGDGRQDILLWNVNPANNKLLISNGDGTFSDSLATSYKSFNFWQGANAVSTGRVVIADFLGDGSNQILLSDFTGGTKNPQYSNQLLIPSVGPLWSVDYLSGVTLSTGETYTIKTVAIAKGDGQAGRAVYKTDFVAGPPQVGALINTTPPAQVTASITSPDGVGGSRTDYYFYNGFKVDPMGRMLGFRQVWQEGNGPDGSTVTSLKEFSQAAPYIGMPVTELRWHGPIDNIGSARMLSSKSTLFCDQYAGSAAASAALAAGSSCAPVSALKRPYVMQTTSINYETNGLAMPTTTVQNQVTSSGDLLNSLSVTTVPGTPPATYTVATTNQFYPDKTDCAAIDTCNWVLGQVQSSTVERAVPSSILAASAGTAPNAQAMQGTASSQSALLTSSLSFGSVLVSGSRSMTAYLTSDGTTPVTVSSAPTVTGTGFSLSTNNCTGTVGANAACSIVVAFAPSVMGASTGTLSVNTSAGAFTASLDGTGIASVATLTSTSSQAFPPAWQGAASSSLSWAYRNDGTAPMTLASPGVAAPLSVTANSCVNIAPGASCAIVVQDDNSVAGLNKTQTFTPAGAFRAPAAASATYNVKTAIPRWDQTDIEMGATPVGSSATAVTALFNDGNSAQDWSSYTVTAPLAVDMSQCHSVAPSGSCNVIFTITPTVDGNYSSGPLHPNNFYPGYANTLTINDIFVTVPSSTPVLNFGSSFLNAAVTQVATFTNNATVPASMTIPSAASVSGSSYFTFVSTTCGSTIAANSSCTATIQFKPTALGMGYAGTLTFVSSEGRATTSLTGNGQQSELQFSPTSYSFGSVMTGSTVSTTVTVTNVGNATALYLPFSFQATGGVTTSTCAPDLAPGASCPLTVTWSPTAAGSYSGTVTSNAATGGSINTFAWNGTATAPPPVVRFNVVSTTGTTTTFSNPNSVAIKPSYAGVSATNNGTVVVNTNTCNASIPAGGSCQIVFQAATPDCKADNYTAQASVTDAGGTASGSVVSRNSAKTQCP